MLLPYNDLPSITISSTRMNDPIHSLPNETALVRVVNQSSQFYILLD